MIVRTEWQRLTPVARADLLHRGVQADMAGRLWRAALGNGNEPFEAARPATAGGIDIDRLVQSLAQAEVAPTAPAPVSEKHGPSVAAPSANLAMGVNSGLQGVVERAGQRTGIPPAALASIIDAEAAKGADGRWNSLSRNPRSSAAGLGQFLSGTWIGEAERTGTWLHSTADQRGWLDAKGRVLPGARANLLALRYDPEASVQATADYARGNLDRLRRAKLAVEGSEQDIARAAYIAHHLGPGDAIKFLRGNLSSDRAAHLLTAQVGAGTANRRIAAAGHDASSAHRHWLETYVDRRIRPDRFLA